MAYPFDLPELGYAHDALEPHIVGPHAPDLARPISRMAEDVETHGFPDELASALIGSCTNSSYEDIGKATHVVQQLLDKGMKAKSQFMISPGSEQVRATIERDGMLDTLTEFGGTVLANASSSVLVGTDWIVVARSSELLVAPYDLNTHQVTGSLVPVEQQLDTAPGIGGMVLTQFDVSDTGTLAYVPVASESAFELPP